MIPQKIAGATRRFDPPKDWNTDLDGPCEPLFIKDDLINGVSTMLSAWKPNAEELQALVDGGSILLGIVGSAHPPVFLFVARESSSALPHG